MEPTSTLDKAITAIEAQMLRNPDADVIMSTMQALTRNLNAARKQGLTEVEQLWLLNRFSEAAVQVQTEVMARKPAAPSRPQLRVIQGDGTSKPSSSGHLHLVR